MSRVHAVVIGLALVTGACGRTEPARTAAPLAPHNEVDTTVTATELPIAARWRGAIAVDDAAGPEVIVIRDDAGYDALLARLPAHRVQMKQPAPPSTDPLRARPRIDFATDMLVVVTRAGGLDLPTLARVERDGAALLVYYAIPSPTPAARPYDVGAYAAVQVPRVDGDARLVAPRVITAEADVAGAVGAWVTLRGELANTRIPTIHGVDVAEGSASPGEPAEATGWLAREVVTQAELDAELAARGQFAHRGAGTFYKLIAPSDDGGGGLARAHTVYRY